MATNKQIKQIAIGLGVAVAVVATAIGASRLTKKKKEKKYRSELPDPTAPRGSDADLAVNYDQKIGLTVYPVGEFATIRSSAKVNDIGNWWDFKTNKLWETASPNPVGVVLKEVMGTENTPKTWYLIRPLSKPSQYSNLNLAYVRSDVVTFKKS